jgi:hypothetical protein
MPPLAPGSWAVRTPNDLQYALEHASPGEELVLFDGTYTGGGEFIATIRTAVTIRARNPGRAVLDGQDERRLVAMAPGGSVTIVGLILTRGLATVTSDPLSSGVIHLGVNLRKLPFLHHLACQDHRRLKRRVWWLAGARCKLYHFND